MSVGEEKGDKGELWRMEEKRRRGGKESKMKERCGRERKERKTGDIKKDENKENEED